LLESHATVAGLRGKICWSEQHTLLIRLGSSKKVAVKKVLRMKVLARWNFWQWGDFGNNTHARASRVLQGLVSDWQIALSGLRISDTTASFVTRIARA
jgi:hypothetical protein